MLNNIHFILLPQTILIILILHWMYVLNNTEAIIYIALFIVIYFVSYLYFQLVIFVFTKKPRLKPKVLQLAVRRLYQIYFVLSQMLVMYGIFSYKGKWDSTAFTILGVSYALCLPMIYFAVKLSVLAIKKIYSK